MRRAGYFVISGSTAIRENEISKETEIQASRNDLPGRAATGKAKRLDPAADATFHQFNGTRRTLASDIRHLVSAYFEEVNREELH